jgi:hypothetical protein
LNNRVMSWLKMHWKDTHWFLQSKSLFEMKNDIFWFTIFLSLVYLDIQFLMWVIKKLRSKLSSDLKIHMIRNFLWWLPPTSVWLIVRSNHWNFRSRNHSGLSKKYVIVVNQHYEKSAISLMWRTLFALTLLYYTLCESDLMSLKGWYVNQILLKSMKIGSSLFGWTVQS